MMTKLEYVHQLLKQVAAVDYLNEANPDLVWKIDEYIALEESLCDYCMDKKRTPTAKCYCRSDD